MKQARLSSRNLNPTDPAVTSQYPASCEQMKASQSGCPAQRPTVTVLFSHRTVVSRTAKVGLTRLKMVRIHHCLERTRISPSSYNSWPCFLAHWHEGVSREEHLVGSPIPRMICKGPSRTRKMTFSAHRHVLPRIGVVQ
jgi:hypothetical protein